MAGQFGGEFFGVIDLVEPEDPDAMAFTSSRPRCRATLGQAREHGLGVERIARAWTELMSRLGYTEWLAQGDWGAAVTAAIGQLAPEGCRGIHLNMPIGRPGPDDMNSQIRTFSKRSNVSVSTNNGSGYSKQQSRGRNHRLCLGDPRGTGGVDKVFYWTDNDGRHGALSMDQVIDDVMLYWLPATGASAARL